MTRKTDLALRALQSLSPDPLKGPELARMIGTTPAYVGQVLAPLIRAGWVMSDPGPTGGYRLAGTASVSMLALIEAVEGPTDQGRCVLREGPCGTPGQTCALHDAWSRARGALVAELAQITVYPPAQKGRSS